MIDVYDDVLEEHNAILIDDEVKKLSWKFDYKATKIGENKHWHIICGHNEEECKKNGYSWADTLFNMFVNKFDFKSKYDVERYERIYCNAHTHGIEPHIHWDDGDFTMIYYPRMDWETEWGGGITLFEELVEGKNYSKSCQLDQTPGTVPIEIDKHINYRGNRLVVFDAYLPHQAQPVSRQCYELRTCVVFKCYVSGVNRDRLDFYKDAIDQGNYKIKFE